MTKSSVAKVMTQISAPSRLFSGPARPFLVAQPWALTLRVIFDPDQWMYYKYKVRLCFRDKGVPTHWTKTASRQLEELRPSLASCLPALQTATPILQLTPETSFPCCCGSWRRPLQCSSQASSDAELMANEHNGERMQSSVTAAVLRREGGGGGASKVQ